jgi:hypothetical protein
MPVWDCGENETLDGDAYSSSSQVAFSSPAPAIRGSAASTPSIPSSMLGVGMGFGAGMKLKFGSGVRGAIGAAGGVLDIGIEAGLAFEALRFFAAFLTGGFFAIVFFADFAFPALAIGFLPAILAPVFFLAAAFAGRDFLADFFPAGSFLEAFLGPLGVFFPFFTGFLAADFFFAICKLQM